MRTPLLGALLLGAAVLASPAPGEAFCGFYVSGADASLYNNATIVVLMRDGVRTVLSMQNNYQGPPQDFAMVVPVPIVLQEENVKTLPREIFARVDRLAAPRLVEYWEQDPCRQEVDYAPPSPVALESDTGSAEEEEAEAERHGVKIEARFNVGEYNILILSAQDSMGLDTFLRRQRYKIPAGAEPHLRPYVTGGSKFFVAKVDARKVRFENGQAMLSPLRFHYDSDTFNLPIRLGLINSPGAQDLIVHVIARSRYEVANYDNYPIPTNITVTPAVKESFGAFYAALFDRILALHPKAVVTEYSWDAGSCDPCPEPPLEPSEIVTLGADALPALSGAMEAGEVPEGFSNNFTLTRLHARYTKDSLGEDLVFRAAPPIQGGTGTPDQNGALQRGVQQTGYNNFQGRYVILHPWTGPIACENPQRGIWGGPIQQVAGEPLKVATNTAFAPRGGIDLATMLSGPVSELEGAVQKLPSGPVTEQPWPELPKGRGGCASCAVGASEGGAAAAALGLGGVIAALGRRRRRQVERR
jgi:MYXO-CTERM domain-containing protein